MIAWNLYHKLPKLYWTLAMPAGWLVGWLVTIQIFTGLCTVPPPSTPTDDSGLCCDAMSRWSETTEKIFVTWLKMGCHYTARSVVVRSCTVQQQPTPTVNPSSDRVDSCSSKSRYPISHTRRLEQQENEWLWCADVQIMFNARWRFIFRNSMYIN